MVLASRLADGRTVFLAAAGTWVPDIAAGALAADAAGGEQLLALARADESRNVVVEPYLIQVREVAGQRRPVEWREVIRAAGPTVRTDLQA
jgi:hypothetical protein